VKAINTHAGVASGKYRQPWRIKEFLSTKGMNMADVAEALGVDHARVSKTVKGTLNNRRVLAWLRDFGVPKEYLSLPKDLS
jgi:transcriptional regulator with XRE-family HTH domain